ncbi:hypothetical protein D3C86_2097010 [compost metagenome]
MGKDQYAARRVGVELYGQASELSDLVTDTGSQISCPKQYVYRMAPVQSLNNLIGLCFVLGKEGFEEGVPLL